MLRKCIIRIWVVFYCIWNSIHALAQTDSTSNAKYVTQGAKMSERMPRVRFAGLPNLFFGPETGFGLGGDGFVFFKLTDKTFNNVVDSTTRMSFVKAVIQGTQLRQFNLQLIWQGFTKSDKIFFDGWFGYQRFPQLFWDRGPRAPDIAEAIDYQFAWIYQKILFKAFKNTYIGGQYVWVELYDLKNSLNQIDILRAKNFNGGNSGYLGSGFGFAIHYDNRNNIVNSKTGTYAEFTFQQFNKTLGSSHYWDWLQIDIRKFILISRRYQNILAMQFKANSVFGTPPFLELIGISLRGYYAGRYRDNHFALFQAEYRMPVYKRFGAVLFGGAGNVANNLHQFELETLKPSYGVGVRFKLIKKDDINIRLDYAIGYQSEAWYLSLTEYF